MAVKIEEHLQGKKKRQKVMEGNEDESDPLMEVAFDGVVSESRSNVATV